MIKLSKEASIYINLEVDKYVIKDSYSDMYTHFKGGRIDGCSNHN
ncbi:hypothetical protein ACH36K_01515 [Clostridium sp. MB05]